MPLDPAIILGGRPPQVQAPDPIAQYATLAQLGNILQQREAQGLQLEQLREQQRGTRALRDLYAMGELDTSTEAGQRAFVNRVGAIAPQQALHVGESFRKQRKDEVEAFKHLAETEKIRAEESRVMLDLAQKKVEFADRILSASTPQTYAQDLQRIAQVGGDVTKLPQAYDAAAIEQARQRSMGALETAKLVLARNEQTMGQQRLGLEGARVANERIRIAQDARRLDLEAARQQAQLQKVQYGLGDDKDAIIYAQYGQQLGPQGKPTPEMVQYADEVLAQRRLNQSAAHGSQALVLKPLEGEARARVAALTQAESVTQRLLTEFTPEERARFVGLGGLRMTQQKARALVDDATNGRADPRYARFAALINLEAAEAFATAGKALTESEKAVVFGYIPTGKEVSVAAFEEKLRLAGERIPEAVERELTLQSTPASTLLEQRRQQGRPGSPPEAPTARGRSVDPAQLKALTDATYSDPRNKNPDGTFKRTREQVQADVQRYLGGQR